MFHGTELHVVHHLKLFFAYYFVIIFGILQAYLSITFARELFKGIVASYRSRRLNEARSFSTPDDTEPLAPVASRKFSWSAILSIIGEPYENAERFW